MLLVIPAIGQCLGYLMCYHCCRPSEAKHKTSLLKFNSSHNGQTHLIAIGRYDSCKTVRTIRATQCFINSTTAQLY